MLTLSRLRGSPVLARAANVSGCRSAFSSEPCFLPKKAWGAMNTLSEYCIALDQGNSKRFAGLFTENGTCEVVKMKSVATGHEELEKLCAGLSARFKGSVHLEANPTLVPTDDPNVCTNESYWQALSGGEVISVGIHVDVLERQLGSGRWLFRSRKIYHTWTKPGGAEKPGAGAWEGVDLPAASGSLAAVVSESSPGGGASGGAAAAVDLPALAAEAAEATARELSGLVRASLARLAAAPLAEPVPLRERATLGLCFGRAAGMLREIEAQKVVDAAVVALSARVEAQRALGRTDDEAAVLLQGAWWSGSAAKPAPLSPVQFALADTRQWLAESNAADCQTRMADVSDCADVLADHANVDEFEVIYAMVRMAAHSYFLREQPPVDAARYRSIMRKGLAALLVESPQRPKLTMDFRNAVISLVVHAELDIKSLQHPELLEALLTTPYLPPFMHASVAAACSPAIIDSLRPADEYGPEVAAVLREKSKRHT